MYICMHVCLNLESSYCYCKIKDKINCDFRRNESFQPRCWCQLQMRIYVCMYILLLPLYLCITYLFLHFHLHIARDIITVLLAFVYICHFYYICTHAHIYTHTHTHTCMISAHKEDGKPSTGALLAGAEVVFWLETKAYHIHTRLHLNTNI